MIYEAECVQFLLQLFIVSVYYNVMVAIGQKARLVVVVGDVVLFTLPELCFVLANKMF